jgi:hypothetical protein
MKWRITAFDLDSCSYQLDNQGGVDIDDLCLFEGTANQAAKEADRRADLFEDRNSIHVIKVAFEKIISGG